MYCVGHVRALLVASAMVVVSCLSRVGTEATARPGLPRAQVQTTAVHLRWDVRPGTSRYRLQLAHDSAFTDIVFDRVVNGNEYEVTDLPPGRYFWRIAALTNERGEFSSAAVITVAAPQKPPTRPPEQPAAPVATDSLVTGDGWRAAIGPVQSAVPGHLRSQSRSEILAVNAMGVTYALDATTGIALWVAPPITNSLQVALCPPLLIQSPRGSDDAIVLLESTVRRFDGVSGREIWRTTVPITTATAAIVHDGRSAIVFIVDTSLRTLLVLNAQQGSAITRVELPARVIGAPLPMEFQGKAAVALAYESGRLEIRDAEARVVRSGNTASTNTTAPLFVKSERGGLVLVGTKSGLTALDAADLRPLGRVALQDDAPRGKLLAADLDSDEAPEVIMLTDRGRVVAVHTSDGKILWQSAVFSGAQTFASAEINRDGVIDVIVTGLDFFGVVLSGRDGSTIWKRNETGNKNSTSRPRSIIALPSNLGTLVIASEATGLHAEEFRKAPHR